MRPYIALIFDSFRQAFASRTLLILIIPITLLLAGAAPFGVREEVATRLNGRELSAPIKLLRLIREEAADSEPTPGKHLWNLLGEDRREQLEQILEGNRSGNRRFRDAATIRRALNGLLEKPEFYDARSWQHIELDTETEALTKQDPKSLGRIQLQRRNRLLLEAAYPELIRAGGSRVVVHYAGFDLTEPFSLGGRSLRKLIGEVIVPAISTILVGNLAVFVAILITAPVIPQLFDPGSLSLLFSKPVVRSLAFLSKFIGGCSLILICAAYLNIGIWLILGLRFGIWNVGWWTTIPVFLFLFAVYYSVSAATGVVWRHAIISVACAGMFWLLGFIISATQGVYEATWIAPREVIRITDSSDQRLAVTRGAGVRVWNAKESQWETIDEGFGLGNLRVLGPVMVENEQGRQLVLARRAPWQGMFDRTELRVWSKTGNQWESATGARLPQGTIALFASPQGDVLAVAQEGIFRLDRLLADDKDNGIPTGFFLKLPRFGKPAAVSLGPDDWALQGPSAAAIDPISGRIAIYDAGEVAVLAPTHEGKYEPIGRTKVVEDGEQGGAIAIGGDTVVCLVVDGDVIELDAKTLRQRRRYRREPKSQPRNVVAAPDGKWFAVTYHNQTVYLLTPNAADGARGMVRPHWLPQRSVDAAGVDHRGRLIVVHGYHRLSTFDVAKEQRVEAATAPLKSFETIYFYGVHPLWRIVPQPGELKNTAMYLISGKETTDGEMQRADIEAMREPLNPWKPVISSGVFLALMLALTCIYIERQDY